MRRLGLLFAVPFLVVAAGCADDSSGGGGGGSPTGPTCLLAGDVCFVASGATFTPTDLTDLQAACEMGWGGTFTASGTCAVTPTVTGYCSIPNGPASTLTGTAIAGMTMRGYYYTPLNNATTANADCTGIGGTWTGGAAPSVCGDGSITGAEVCDGANLSSQTCITRGFTGGTLSCAANCLSFNVSACTGGGGGNCGNGTLDAGEVCDGANLSGESCTLNGFSGGTLACASTCLNFNTASCTGAPAGWRCDPNYYAGSDGCDCGCGIVDPDCSSAAASACQFCNEFGSCASLFGSCPSNINPANNATCN